MASATRPTVLLQQPSRMIPDDQVEEVRARADIVQVIGDIVPLRKSGKDYKACCPFHDEKTPSFYVVPAKGFYKCFGCGESGDTFAFLMKHLGLSFVDAVKHAAASAGVEIREVSRGQTGEDPFRHLFEANAFARMFFQDSLWDETAGGPARAYLEERGIGRETAERFGLGYAPDAWRGLREAASHHGIEEEALMEVGLVTRSEKRKDPYDRFRDRLIFPIESLSGKVLAFGGRVLGAGREGLPKYLNSPESPIYHKGGVLYGLSWAKNAIRRRRRLWWWRVTWMSCPSLRPDSRMRSLRSERRSLQNRWPFSAAIRRGLTSCSIATRPGSRRRSERRICSWRQVCTPPSLRFRPERIRTRSYTPREPRRSKATSTGPSTSSTGSYRSWKSEIISGASSRREQPSTGCFRRFEPLRIPALRDIYVAKVSERTGVRRDTLEGELARVAPPPAPQRAARRRDHRRPSVASVPEMGPERELLLLMTKGRDWIERVGERLGPDDFVDVRYRAVFESLLADRDLTHPPEKMVPEAARVLEELLADPTELNRAHRVFEESLGKILSTLLQERLDAVDHLLQNTLDEHQETQLLVEKARLSKERRELGQDWSPTVRRALKGNHL